MKEQELASQLVEMLIEAAANLSGLASVTNEAERKRRLRTIELTIRDAKQALGKPLDSFHPGFRSLLQPVIEEINSTEELIQTAKEKKYLDRFFDQHARQLYHCCGFIDSYAQPEASEDSCRDIEEKVATDYVTLLQAASLVNKSKRQIERYKAEDKKFPTADVKGEKGEADEWKWSRLRPYLEEKCKRELPEQFPAHKRG